MKKISVIIPTFNEQSHLEECIKSLEVQTYPDFEIIIVDDGSTDNTLNLLEELRPKNKLIILNQPHKGPGLARNLGAKSASGEILVFVDTDMTFDKDFLANLVKLILEDGVIGTFSKDEYLQNKENVWSRCWNINKGLPLDKMHNKDYPDEQAVFRSILKKEFDKVGGFGAIGYIDDYTLSEKLGVKAQVAKGAIFYHKNPSSLKEVFNQARWVGKSEYKRRKIENESLMKIISLIRYSPPFTLINGISKSIIFNTPQFLIFKIVYDLAVEISLINSFFGEQKYR